MIVRAMDTDILIVLINLLAKELPEDRKQITIDCGFGNKRRLIKVNDIVSSLENRSPGLPKALPGLHAFTGLISLPLSTGKFQRYH